jgi:hypothetical protein
MRSIIIGFKESLALFPVYRERGVAGPAPSPVSVAGCIVFGDSFGLFEGQVILLFGRELRVPELRAIGQGSGTDGI